MRELNQAEIYHVSGGDNPITALTFLGAAVGAYVGGTVAETLEPVSTVLATVGLTVTGMVIGTAVMPIVGTVVVGTCCGVAGYYLGSTFITAGSYIGGAAIGGLAATILPAL